MPSYAFILGSHPALSTAEVLAFFQRTGRRVEMDSRLLPHAIVITTDEPGDTRLTLRNLGGIPYAARIVGDISAPTPEELLSAISSLSDTARSRTVIGLSVFSAQVSARDVRGIGMALKRTLRGQKTRFVFPQKTSTFTSAELFHAGFPESGTAIVLFPAPQSSTRSRKGEVRRIPNGYRVGIVEAVQDIAGYARRDRGRPEADPGSGMLPPKVAQMLMNLSLVPVGGTIYDPFCGTGTIPMEAALMGLHAVASDASPTQVERTRKNLAWLAQEFSIAAEAPRVFQHDVTRRPFPLENGSVDAVVTEGTLGPPRTRAPLPRDIEDVHAAVIRIIDNVFQHSRALLKPAGHIVVTLPAFRLKKRMTRFPLERLKTSGFRLDPVLPSTLEHPIFRDASSGTILYGRPDAIVLREIARFRKN
jgi:SAM-dependent methyltransferase